MASEIANLAALVLTNTVRVDDYLQTNCLPSPSFHEDGPVDLKLSVEIEAAREVALGASLRLNDLLRGPMELLRPTVNAVSLEAIYKYDIASKVPIHGEISVVELAKLCDICEPDLRRILRFAISHHRVFQEPRKGMIAHSAASRRIVEDSATRDGLGLQFADGWQSFARTVEAMEKWKEQEPAKTGFALAHNTDKSAFDYLEENPAKAKRFAGAMSSFATFKGHGPESLVGGFPWASLGSKTVIDVGGSEGKYSIALAQSFPDLKFIIQDLPAVVRAVDTKRPVPSELADRVTFMAHDMFKEQPVSADIYLYRWVFHDWPDAYVVKVLRQLIPALKPGARVIINDTILPEPNTLSELQERKIRALDMVMLSFFNSRERERDDWERIFQEVDKRFRFVDAWVPEGSALGIIEAVWEAETVNGVNGVNGVNEVNKAKEVIVFKEVDGVNGINEVKEVHGIIEVKEVREVNGSDGY